jgi:hypothetical protein
LTILTLYALIMSHASTAARAFERTLEQLERQEGISAFGDPAALGRRAALLAAAEAVWGRQLGPLFDLEQTKAALGVGTRQAVSDLAKRGRLLALDASGGRKLYPSFQFSPSGRPYPEIARVLEIFAGQVETPYTIASWLVSPQDFLRGETPAAWMRSGHEPEPLYESARRAAARLAQ